MAAMLCGCGNEELKEPIATTREAAFLESGGQVVMEAEHFTANVTRGDSWQSSTTGSPSGGQALAALPDNDTNNNANYTTLSPQLDFAVTFAQTGTYRVWVRGRDSGTTTGNGDSVHAGLDGVAIATADRISSFTSSFGWSKSTMDNVEATVNVTTPGNHTVNIWMREDGFVIDKLLLTTSTSSTPPTGSGPPESPQQGGCTPATYEAEAMSNNTGGSTTGGWNIWSNGSIWTNHVFAAGPTTLTVTAQGTIAAGVWPHMVVRVGSVNGTGGTVIGDVMVASSSWTQYPFFFTASGGTQEISVSFDNDLNQPPEDRNLLVDKVDVVCGGTAPTCTDAIKNGNETDVDCGGPTCPDCANGKLCLVNGDCVSGNCNLGTCQPPGSIPPYKDPSVAIPARVDDLLMRMTLDEKIGQMTQCEARSNQADVQNLFLGSVLSGGNNAPSVPNAAGWADYVDSYQTRALATRLGIPIIYGIDAVHGHAKVLGATIFPHNIGLGATRDPALVQEIAAITAQEAKATGIPWVFAPAFSVARDQRWGRTYESFGEDPALVSTMTTSVVGYQGAGSSLPNKVLASAKHFLGDGAAVWGTGMNGNIDRGDAIISDAALRAIHLAPYAGSTGAIARGVGSVMASFNSVNGTKMHANPALLNGVLRGELGFTGFVISDWQAIDFLPHATFAEKVTASVNAGVDMFMMPDSYGSFISTLRAEVNANRVLPSRIDEAVRRILTKKFQLGLFENPLADRSGASQIGSTAHRDVARRAVRQSLVLLKHQPAILPLAEGAGGPRVCVTGNEVDNLEAHTGAWTMGWQAPNPPPTGVKTIRQGIAALGNLQTTSCQVDVRIIAEAPREAYAEYEGDNPNPANDNSGTCATSSCIVILLGGRPTNIESLVSNTNVRAIIMAWYPGSEADAVADVLYGRNNFTGKLPVTWKRDAVDTPVNYCTGGDSCADTGAEYTDPLNPPTNLVLYPYGFGLSYGTGPTCTDSMKNGAETDTDCGGGTCPDCVDGRVCLVSGDCTGNNCVSGTCCSVLAAPTGLSAMPGNAQVNLTWNAVSGAESYNVKRGSAAGGPHTTVGTSPTASFLNTSLTNGTTYFYVTSAVNTCGPVSTESTNSSEVSATPSAGGSCTPTTPGCEFQMSGNVASVEGEHYFAIVTPVTPGDTWSLLGAPAASGTQAMQVGPDSGNFWTTIGTIQTTSPMLQFKVNFSAGSFFLHLRGDAANGSADSCWGGIDGVLRASNSSPTIYDFPETAGSWAWRSVSLGAVAAGIHDINVFAREDGFILDKLVINTSSTAPSMAGPAESVLN
jgi:beta-glucosidase